MVPKGSSGSWRMRLGPGDYSSGMPNYWEQRRGRIVIEAQVPRRPPLLAPMNVFQVQGLRLRNLRLVGGGDVFHCEQCTGVRLERVTLRGVGAGETVKINQSRDITIVDSDLGGAGDNAFDAVAVHGLRLERNRIHDATDWCGYVKGGSTRVVVRDNVFFRCGTGGFSVGQGTGFQFMTWPFVHYEASAVLVQGNTVHDVEGAAFGVQGGYNVLIQDNVATRVGARSHVLEVGYGSRSCDGRPGDDGRESCGEYLAKDGWGTTRVDDGTNYVEIPNRHVLIYDNAILNPDDQASQWQVFQVAGATTPDRQEGSNVPPAARADDDLRIVGNVIWDGGPDHALGLGEESCRAGSSCAVTRVRENNQINEVRPDLRRGASGRLMAEGIARHDPPPPDWTDRPAVEAPLWSEWPR